MCYKIPDQPIKEYAPYGERINDSTADTYDQPFRFSTKWFDDACRLGYWGYRHYDAMNGRWASQDPIGILDSANLYLYVGNLPASKVDFAGLFRHGRVKGVDSVGTKTFSIETEQPSTRLVVTHIPSGKTWEFCTGGKPGYKVAVSWKQAFTSGAVWQFKTNESESLTVSVRFRKSESVEEDLISGSLVDVDESGAKGARPFSAWTNRRIAWWSAIYNTGQEGRNYLFPGNQISVSLALKPGAMNISTEYGSINGGPVVSAEADFVPVDVGPAISVPGHLHFSYGTSADFWFKKQEIDINWILTSGGTHVSPSLLDFITGGTSDTFVIPESD